VDVDLLEPDHIAVQRAELGGLPVEIEDIVHARARMDVVRGHAQRNRAPLPLPGGRCGRRERRSQQPCRDERFHRTTTQ